MKTSKELAAVIKGMKPIKPMKPGRHKQKAQSDLIRRIFGDLYDVEDADEKMVLVITDEDWRLGIPGHPKLCAAARCVKRNFHLDDTFLGVAFLEDIAYVPVPDPAARNGMKILRFRFGSNVRGRLEKAHKKWDDRKGKPANASQPDEPCIMTLHPPSASMRLEARRLAGKRRRYLARLYGSPAEKRAHFPTKPRPPGHSARTTRAGKLFGHHQTLIGIAA